MTTIGMVGLGHMGSHMATNLMKAGNKVYAYDVMPQAIQKAVEHGAMAADSIASLTKHCDVVITMVQTGQQVSDLCLGKEGIFAHAKPGLLFIDCSSIDIVVTRQLHEEAVKKNIAMLDAPVSGGVAGAEAGSLTFMVGGSADNFERAKPLLAQMGKKLVHAGKPGSGQAAKICNNLILGISMIGVSEAFVLAEKLGLTPQKFFEISSNASGQCWSMTSYCPSPGILDNVPSSRDYQPGFMAKMMLKDLRLAHHAAETVDTPIPLGAVATELYDLYVTQGHGEKDFSGIIQMLNHSTDS